jgi:hypothetical protein
MRQRMRSRGRSARSTDRCFASLRAWFFGHRPSDSSVASTVLPCGAVLGLAQWGDQRKPATSVGDRPPGRSASAQSAGLCQLLLTLPTGVKTDARVPWGPDVIRLLVALVAVLVALGTSPSDAHRISARSGPPPQGISIPSLTHGQMTVISDNLSEIRALASTRIGFDMTTWRLEDYLNLQSFACLWGIVPGSIRDEGSPFNECAHAYLAAGRALLLQLREAPGVDHEAVKALMRKIEADMLANDASLMLCRYSDEPFNTNEVIWPHWSEIPFHPPTAGFAAAAFVAIAVTAWGAWPRRRLRQQGEGAGA